MRSNIIFEQPAEFVFLSPDDGVLCSEGADWLVSLLRQIPGLQIGSLLILILALTGCGGGGSDQQTPPVNNDTPPTLTVSGTVAGLTGSGLTLVAIGATANGGQFSVEPGATAFTYSSATTITEYRIEILQQPSGQVCVLANNSGVLSQSFRAVEIICDDLPRDSLSGTYQVDGRRSFVTFFSNGSFLLGSRAEVQYCS